MSSLSLLLHLPFLPSVRFLIFHPYATSSFSTPFFALPSLLLPFSLCHFFSSPSHLLPFLRRAWHAHGPNSIIDQIKEMLLNSLNRQKDHTHAADMLKGYNHTEANTYSDSAASAACKRKQHIQLLIKWTNCNFRLCPGARPLPQV